MARFAGMVGFALIKDPGDDNDTWVEELRERFYRGTVLQNVKRYESGTGVNDNVVLNERISIVADRFFQEHYGAVRYVVKGGVKWKVTSVDIQRPRLILTLGDVYNG